MYPDKDDIKREMRGLPGGPFPPLDDLWKQTVYMWNFLNESRGYCYNHGRHEFIALTNLKKFAETFIGPVSDSAVQIALKLRGLTMKSSKGDGNSAVKLPPLERFEERREAWIKCQQELTDKDIAFEIEAEKQRPKPRL